MELEVLRERKNSLISMQAEILRQQREQTNNKSRQDSNEIIVAEN